MARYNFTSSGCTDGFDSVNLIISDPSSCALNQDTDYAYNISADISGTASVTITSKTIYGAAYGLETLNQLTDEDFHSVPSSIDVVDSPSYNHRGFMIDTGRRFIPLSTIFKNIDAMAMNKLNVLHLHFADWCRYAIESDSFPSLTSSLVGDQAGHYTKQDVRDMIEYANDRGIRVIPEVDLPGHSTWGFPLKTSGDLKYCTATNPPSLLDDADGKTEATLKTIISEVIELFGEEELFHIGADEIATLDDEGCTIENIAGIETKIFQHIVDSERTPVCWEEGYYKSGGAEGFEGEAVINAWNAGPRPNDIIADGFDAIESMSDNFYLNNKPSWSAVWYDISSTPSSAESSKSPTFRGGEVSMWTDNYCYALQCGAFGPDQNVPVGAALYPPSMDDQFTPSFMGMVWPKAAIAAGAFWNYYELTDDDLKTKIEGVANRLKEAAIDACPNDCDCDELTRCGDSYIN
ncbi:hypothetical protein TrVE_jg10005 [Triparma verrucosa]|uniref:beta-N-acetylhexosaminidase n=1 Tax=Triparma verrucosa TaxID=1606542 RepID=A0A9W7KXX5_9STRA|nr:hypothetical protein TrVE_jg10005 [Triparma verrucosa]